MALADAGFPRGDPHRMSGAHSGTLRQLGFTVAMSRFWIRFARPGAAGFQREFRQCGFAKCGDGLRPSAGAGREEVHLTVANLNNNFIALLGACYPKAYAIFRDESQFSVHSALLQVALLGDEGAANHSRWRRYEVHGRRTNFCLWARKRRMKYDPRSLSGAPGAAKLLLSRGAS